MLGVSTAAPCALLLKLVVREALAGGFLVGECDVVGGLGVAELPSLGHVAAEGGYLVFLELVFDALGVVSRPTAVAICWIAATRLASGRCWPRACQRRAKTDPLLPPRGQYSPGVDKKTEDLGGEAKSPSRRAAATASCSWWHVGVRSVRRHARRARAGVPGRVRRRLRLPLLLLSTAAGRRARRGLHRAGGR